MCASYFFHEHIHVEQIKDCSKRWWLLLFSRQILTVQACTYHTTRDWLLTQTVLIVAESRVPRQVVEANRPDQGQQKSMLLHLMRFKWWLHLFRDNDNRKDNIYFLFSYKMKWLICVQAALVIWFAQNSLIKCFEILGKVVDRKTYQQMELKTRTYTQSRKNPSHLVKSFSVQLVECQEKCVHASNFHLRSFSFLCNVFCFWDSLKSYWNTAKVTT